MSRKLDDIHPKARPFFNDFLARLIESQILVLIVFTGRTPKEQADLYAIGRTDGQPASKQVTWTLESKHVMTPERDMKSVAIDVVPFELYTIAPGGDKLDWTSTDPIWDQIGMIGVACGLKWGVLVDGVRKDKGHFEYLGPLT